MTFKVSFLDVMARQVRGAIAAAAPVEFDVAFAHSSDADVQRALVADAEFIIAGWQPVTAQMIAAAPRLRMIQKWGIGYDRFDLEAARARGIAVAITSGANAGPVAEHAIALMLAVYRRLPFVDRKTRDGVWLKSEMRSECYQVAGKAIGLVGFGNIARMVARRLRGFDAEILYASRTRAEASIEQELGVRHVSLEALLEHSDIVSIHLPLTPQTRHLIDAAAIDRMKTGAVVINTARGGIVDETALHAALVSGKLHGAGLDVFEHEPAEPGNSLFALDQVVVTPHSGGAVFDNVDFVARRAFGNMLRLARGQAIDPADLIVAPGP